jgi:hypothetical protein
VPHYTVTARFRRDLAGLAPDMRERFQATVRDAFVPDLAGGGTFRPGLRVKRVQGTRGVFEMTFAPDGRATWQYGDEREPGVAHVIWLRVGTHDVLGQP